ncbi:MAG: hypothetical protein OEV39_11020 [Gammaproteobacteria bacterium]|jgi:hypothetical protein|nr:hypothetical protein [Gammaproteobacteria bacterium]MDH5177848.1 hypothetical protein [Gammaproteobacteria bacterium]
MNSRFLGLAACLVLGSMTVSAREATTPAPAASPTAAAVAEPQAKLNLSNKWRLEVSEGANNDGTMLFRITPDKGTPQDVVVTLKKGRGEDGCARDIRDTFKAKLDKKTYHIEIDDGEDVLVKKRKGPNFEIKLVESTVKGTRVNVEKE